MCKFIFGGKLGRLRGIFLWQFSKILSGSSVIWGGGGGELPSSPPLVDKTRILADDKCEVVTTLWGLINF